jgi:hypothetical protein
MSATRNIKVLVTLDFEEDTSVSPEQIARSVKRDLGDYLATVSATAYWNEVVETVERKNYVAP